MRTLFIGVVLFSAPWLTAPAAAQSDLTEAKTQYEEAAYEDALTTLTKASPSTPADRVQLEQYRALCLIALGRLAEAERAVAAMVEADPPTFRHRRRLAAGASMVADIRGGTAWGVPPDLDSGRASFGQETRPGAAAVRAAAQAPRRSGDEGRPEREDCGPGQGTARCCRAAAGAGPPEAPVSTKAGGAAHAGLQQFGLHAAW